MTRRARRAVRYWEYRARLEITARASAYWSRAVGCDNFFCAGRAVGPLRHFAEHRLVRRGRRDGSGRRNGSEADAMDAAYAEADVRGLEEDDARRRLEESDARAEAAAYRAEVELAAWNSGATVQDAIAAGAAAVGGRTLDELRAIPGTDLTDAERERLEADGFEKLAELLKRNGSEAE